MTRNLELAEVVFEGVALSSESGEVEKPLLSRLAFWRSPDPFSRFVVFHFDVERVWKGADVEELSVRSAPNEGLCGVNFELGSPQLVVAWTGLDGALGTGFCTYVCGTPNEYLNALRSKGE